MHEIDRQKQIMKLLNEQRMVKTANLIKLFNVSSETIRRDFIRLENKGLLKKVYGGAVLDNMRGSEIKYENRKGKNVAEKQAIGKLAALLVNDGETVVLNSGLTVLEVARNLLDKRDLTIITNCMYVALTLLESESSRVFFVGGELRKIEVATSGHFANEFLSRFCPDKAIIGIGGIDTLYGVTDYHIEESYIWREMVRIARKTIVVADFSKFGVSALNVVCSIPEISTLVTDWNVPDRELNKYRRQGVQILIAKPSK